MKSIAMSVFLLVAATSLAQTQNPVLVELFTSEGCSSCPPADALLARVDGKAMPSGQLIVALSEHVTYWNQLGWADPFSQQIFTERQQDYAAAFHIEGPYTPQIVVNGAKEILGSDGSALAKALAVQPPPSVLLKIASVVRDGKSLQVTYALSGPNRHVDVWAAVAQDRATTTVARGENGGKTLSHVSVVRSLTKVATAKPGESLTVKVPAGEGNEKRHVVLFAQTPGLGPVLGIVTAPLQ